MKKLYALSELSVAPFQELYRCRLLRHPHEFLDPALTDSQFSILQLNQAGVPTGTFDDYEREVFRISENIRGENLNRVPLLEFSGPDTSILSDVVGVEVGDDSTSTPSITFLVAGHQSWPEDLKVTCFWCPTLGDAVKSIENFKKALDKIKEDMDQVQALTIKIEKSIPTKVEGEPDTLGAIDTETNVVSSGFTIKQGPTRNVELNYPQPAEIAKIPKSLRCRYTLLLSQQTYVFTDFQGGTIVIQGDGDIYLYNVKSRVEFRNFQGSVTAHQSSDIVVYDGAVLSKLNLIYSNAEILGGVVKELYIARHSVVNHVKGRVNNINRIGVSCTYTSSVPPELSTLAGAYSIDRKKVNGLYSDTLGTVIKNGQDISFQRGQVDNQTMCSEMIFTRDTDYIPPEGEGVDPIPPVTGGMAIPSTHYDICTEDYRTIAFTQAFMLTSAPPQTVDDITSETFHTLRALWAWCMEEFGPSVYGQSFSKLLRTMALYPPHYKNAYRGKGKTLKDLTLNLRSDVLSWGGWDIWNVSYEWVKAQAAVTDAQVLEFMQNLYKNIRYPELFGVDSSTDPDIIKAMSGMPIMNETISTTNHNIPSRNYPLVWYVQKQVTTTFTWWYVVYRPVSYNYSINLGPNAAVL